MPKVVINTCYGGFQLSKEAETILKFRNVDVHNLYDCDLRQHPDVIDVVQSLGALANGPYSELKIIEVPDGVRWHIAEYDGCEWVAEDHRKWS